MSAAKHTPIRYFVSRGQEQAGPIPAWLLKEDGIRVVVGEYSIRFDRTQTDGWQVFKKTVLGTREAVDGYHYVEGCSRLRDAIALARRLTRRDNEILALRAAGRLP